MFEVGDRIIHIKHRMMGHIDRVLPNRNLIVITDNLNTVVACPCEVDHLMPAQITDKDLRFLKRLKVRW